MSEKERTTVYVLKALRLKASVMMKHFDFGENFTGFVEQLIREKWNQCVTPSMEADLRKASTQPAPAPTSEVEPTKRGSAGLVAKNNAPAKGTTRKRQQKFGQG